MSLSMEPMHRSGMRSSEVPPHGPAIEERRSRPGSNAAFLPALQVHPAAGTLSLSPDGRLLGPANSASTGTSWSSSSDTAEAEPRPRAAEEEEERPTAQYSPLTEEESTNSPKAPESKPMLRRSTDGQSGQESTLRRPMVAQSAQRPTPGRPIEAQSGQGSPMRRRMEAQSVQGSVLARPMVALSAQGPTLGRPMDTESGQGSMVGKPNEAQSGQRSMLGSPTEAQSGQGSTLQKPIEAQSGQASTLSPNEIATTQSVSIEQDVSLRHVQLSVEPEVTVADSPAFAHLYQPLLSHSAPTILDGDKPKPTPLQAAVYPPRDSPMTDLWKTPFWIIDDFQAPCQPCRRGDEFPPAPPPAETGPGPAEEPVFQVNQQPPYYDLEPEDLAGFLTFHPNPEPCVRDSELMDVPDDDLEFWGKFYFAGVEKARELLRQRRRLQK